MTLEDGSLRRVVVEETTGKIQDDVQMNEGSRRKKEETVLENQQNVRRRRQRRASVNKLLGIVAMRGCKWRPAPLLVRQRCEEP